MAAVEVVNTSFQSISVNGGVANSTRDQIWQSFTAQNTVGYLNLRSVQLYGKTPDDGSIATVNIYIYNGVGTAGALLTSVTGVVVNSQPLSWTTFQFPAPYLVLTPGSQYTIYCESDDFLWGYAFNTSAIYYPYGVASFQPPSSLFFIVNTINVPTDPAQSNVFDFVQCQNRSAAAPAYTFTNDLSTGMYLESPGVLGFSNGGVSTLTMNGNYLPRGPGRTLGGPGTTFSNLWLDSMSQPFFISQQLFAPVFEDALSGPIFGGYTAQNGMYTIVGTVVTFNIYVNFTSGISGSNNLLLLTTGLPLPASPNADIFPLGYYGSASLSITLNELAVQFLPATNSLQFLSSTFGNAMYATSHLIEGGTAAFAISGSYIMQFPQGPPE